MMATRKRAVDGIQQLIDRTCGPDVVASVVVDQVYAQMQHEALEFRHPRGGMAKYLEIPMFQKAPFWLENFAQHLLLKQGTAENRWAAHVGRPLRDVVKTHAPVEFGDLRASASLRVTAGGEVVVEEPARQPRLTGAELDGKDELRSQNLRYS